MFDELPTPCILIDAGGVRRNLKRLAVYAAGRNLKIRPHAKTHKSSLMARLQIEYGASGLTVAKVGEAKVMAGLSNDVLMAYPAVDPRRCAELAELARSHSVRVGLDSATAADALAATARSAGSTIGILVDLDVCHHRIGVQRVRDVVVLA